jgi:hypothetical protein
MDLPRGRVSGRVGMVVERRLAMSVVLLAAVGVVALLLLLLSGDRPGAVGPVTHDERP